MKKVKIDNLDENVLDSSEEVGTPRPGETEGGHPIEKPLTEDSLED